VISLVVQGLTLEPLVRLAGITRPGGVRHEETVARLRLAEAAPQAAGPRRLAAKMPGWA
jgi:hypothetical protein